MSRGAGETIGGGRGGPREICGLRDGIIAADQALARWLRIEKKNSAAGTCGTRWMSCAATRATSPANSNARLASNDADEARRRLLRAKV